MTLDDYRAQTTQKLRALRDPKQASSLVSEVQFFLKGMGVGAATRLEFWQLLRRDLEVVAHEATTLVEKSSATVLRDVIFAALRAIAAHQKEEADQGETPPRSRT
jgi:hypothetical protein